jgi:hypothetical protein
MEKNLYDFIYSKLEKKLNISFTTEEEFEGIIYSLKTDFNNNEKFKFVENFETWFYDEFCPGFIIDNWICGQASYYFNLKHNQIELKCDVFSDLSIRNLIDDVNLLDLVNSKAIKEISNQLNIQNVKDKIINTEISLDFIFEQNKLNNKSKFNAFKIQDNNKNELMISDNTIEIIKNSLSNQILKFDIDFITHEKEKEVIIIECYDNDISLFSESVFYYIINKD